MAAPSFERVWCSIRSGLLLSWLELHISRLSATAPKVISTFPRNGREVGPAANIRATFSEDMRPASVMNAFKLFKKGSTNQIAAQVSYDAATDTATLNPTNNLRRDVTYKAVVTTVAKDVAGNRLDQITPRRLTAEGVVLRDRRLESRPAEH